MNKAIIYGLVVLGLFGGVWWLGQERKRGTVAVTGQAEGMAKPESVSMVVTKVNIGSEASKAVAEGELGINQLIEETKRVTENRAEIKKGFYQLSAQSSGDWLVANAISVKLTDLTKMEETMKMFYDRGAISVNNVSFVPQGGQKLEDDLRKTAVKNAKEEALKIVTAGGVKLGKMVSMSDEPMSVSGTADGLSLVKKVSIIFEIK